MSSPISKIVSQTLKKVNYYFGEEYSYRGALIKGVPNFTPGEKDLLKFEQGSLPNSVCKIEVMESELPDGVEPMIGEYLVKDGRNYEIFTIEYFGQPKCCYILFCSVTKA